MVIKDINFNINNLVSLNDFINLGLISSEMYDYLVCFDILSRPFIAICENESLNIFVLHRFLSLYYKDLKLKYSSNIQYMPKEIDYSNSFNSLIYDFNMSLYPSVCYMYLENLSIVKHNLRNISNIMSLRLKDKFCFGSYIGLEDELFNEIQKWLHIIYEGELNNIINNVFEFTMLSFKLVNTKTMAVELGISKIDMKNNNFPYILQKEIVHKFSLDNVSDKVWTGEFKSTKGV